MDRAVSCPICSRLVPEGDINLHLDLQCPGEGGPSSAPTSSAARHQASSRRGSSPDVVALDEPKSKRPTQVIRSSGQVASIFGGVKGNNGSGSQNTREKHTLQADDQAARRRKRGSVEEEKLPTDAGGKKAKVNPLIAVQPLAERSRPVTLAAYIGQTDLVGPGSLLRARIEAGEGVGSCILWGPPGCGKTTLGRLIAKTANADFKELSATSSGAADVRAVFEQAKNGLQLTGRKTILFIDEIHRFTRPQQDLFLPYVENGWVQLIGATTENPSFKVNGALLSRCQVFTLSAHTSESLETILRNALEAVPPPLPHLPPDLLPFLADVADGDARQALNGLELAIKICETPQQASLNSEGQLELGDQAERDASLMEAVQKGLRKGYNRTGEERYDMISALHKCLRGSDGSAAMYWLARMITGGEDPLYIARRLVVVASEDVGLADNHALPLAMATYQACQVIGLPECRINLAHLVAYLAEAPKSTRSYTAYKRAEALTRQPPLPGVPLQIRNAPTKLMKSLGYGKSYAYNPGFAHPVHNEYLPETLLQHSSFSHTKADHLLKSPDEELKEKEWDDERLKDYEKRVLQGKQWDGRARAGQHAGANGVQAEEPVPSRGISEEYMTLWENGELEDPSQSA